MTAQELLRIARKGRPNVRYTVNQKHNAIAAHYEGRWVAVAALGIDDRWYSVEHELLVDGKPVFDNWIE